MISLAKQKLALWDTLNQQDDEEHILKKEKLIEAIVNQKSDAEKCIVTRNMGKITIKRFYVVDRVDKDELDSGIDSPERIRKCDSNHDLIDLLIAPINNIDLNGDDDGSFQAMKNPKDKKPDSEPKPVKMMKPNGEWCYCRSDYSFQWISCPFDRF